MGDLFRETADLSKVLLIFHVPLISRAFYKFIVLILFRALVQKIMRHRRLADPNSRIHPQQTTLICKHPEGKNRRCQTSHQEIYDSYGRILHQHDQIQAGTHLGIQHQRLHHPGADHLLTPPRPLQLCRKKYGIRKHGCVALLMPSILALHRNFHKLL